MRYYVLSNSDESREEWKTTLENRGFDVVEEYDADALVVTLGGDGTILYAARQYANPMILPVRTGDSKGYRTTLETDQLVDALGGIEDGEYTVTEHPKLTAYRDGNELHGGFRALNEINLHHVSPTLAAVFAVRVRGVETHEFERVYGDGILVATPFGSTAYYRSITGTTFSEGLGLAFNNVHSPAETPAYMTLPNESIVELELLESRHASGAALVRDNAEETYELTVGEQVEIQLTNETVRLLSPAPR